MPGAPLHGRTAQGRLRGRRPCRDRNRVGGAALAAPGPGEHGVEPVDASNSGWARGRPATRSAISSAPRLAEHDVPSDDTRAAQPPDPVCSFPRLPYPITLSTCAAAKTLPSRVPAIRTALSRRNRRSWPPWHNA